MPDMTPRLRDREDAGRRLAARLEPYADRRPIVLALPRGGLPVGFEIAAALHAPLDIWIVRKLGLPWHPELGVGAVAEGGYTEISRDILTNVGLEDDELELIAKRERAEVEARVRRFRRGHPAPELRGRTVIVVDDGIATGATVRAALQSIRSQAPAQLVLAVPVAPADTLAQLQPLVDDIVCLLTVRDLYAIGLWYEQFDQVPDATVLDLLERAREAA